jgi:hypothetical protein
MSYLIATQKGAKMHRRGVFARTRITEQGLQLLLGDISVVSDFVRIRGDGYICSEKQDIAHLTMGVNECTRAG